MKTAATSFAQAIASPVVAPIWLIELGLSATLRYNTSDANVTYNGSTYTAQDFKVSGASFGNSGSANANVTFQGVDETFTALFRQGDAEGSTVKIWKTSVQANYTAADTAFQLIESTIDSLALTSTAITLRLARQPIFWPAQRADIANGFNFLVGAGVAQFPAGSQVLS